jgi:hypothetical protein
MIKWGLAGAAILTWAYFNWRYSILVRRRLPWSEQYPVELLVRGERSYISATEAWALALLVVLAFGFFLIGWLMHHRPDLRPFRWFQTRA